MYASGQIIATSHNLTSKGSWGREIPLFKGNLGWWIIIVWPDVYLYICGHLWFCVLCGITEKSLQQSTSLDVNFSVYEGMITSRLVFVEGNDLELDISVIPQRKELRSWNPTCHGKYIFNDLDSFWNLWHDQLKVKKSSGFMNKKTSCWKMMIAGLFNLIA